MSLTKQHQSVWHHQRICLWPNTLIYQQWQAKSPCIGFLGSRNSLRTFLKWYNEIRKCFALYLWYHSKCYQQNEFTIQNLTLSWASKSAIHLRTQKIPSVYIATRNIRSCLPIFPFKKRRGSKMAAKTIFGHILVTASHRITSKGSIYRFLESRNSLRTFLKWYNAFWKVVCYICEINRNVIIKNKKFSPVLTVNDYYKKSGAKQGKN